MKAHLRLAAVLATGLVVCACDSGADESAPAGAVSEGEAAALDEAAKMLDDQRLPEGALPDIDPPLSNAETPSPEPPASEPSSSETQTNNPQ